MQLRYLVFCLALVSASALASTFGGNSIKDLFEITSIGEKEAIATGETKGLHVNDSVYFSRSPYKFTITSIEGNKIRVALPGKSDIAVGQTLFRNINDQIKKSIDTEKRLKQAVDE